MEQNISRLLEWIYLNEIALLSPAKKTAINQHFLHKTEHYAQRKKHRLVMTV